RVAELTTPPSPPPTVVQTPRVVAVQNVVAPAPDPKAKAKAAAEKKGSKSTKDATAQVKTADQTPATTTTTDPSTTQQSTTTQQDGSTVALDPGAQGGTSNSG